MAASSSCMMDLSNTLNQGSEMNPEEQKKSVALAAIILVLWVYFSPLVF